MPSGSRKHVGSRANRCGRIALDHERLELALVDGAEASVYAKRVRRFLAREVKAGRLRAAIVDGRREGCSVRAGVGARAGSSIDGRIYFHEVGTTQQVILSVKAGKLHAPYMRGLRGVLEREKAAIAVLLTLDKPTKAMRTGGRLRRVLYLAARDGRRACRPG
jgi:hypothetical protein